MDQDQGAVLSGSTLFVEVVSNYKSIGAPIVNKCNGQDFHEMHARLRSSNNLLTLYILDRT